MNRRQRHDFDEDIDEDMDELTSRFGFRNPNDKKRNRHGKNEPSYKEGKRHRSRNDEPEFDGY